MSDLPSGNGALRSGTVHVPILIFIRNDEIATEQRDSCPQCGSTWDTWVCYGTREETGNFAMLCWCGLKFEQVRGTQGN